MRLKIACWNVLADCYSSSSWEERWCDIKRVLEAMIHEHGVNLFLLQEIDHFHDFYEPFLRSIGFLMMYVQRPHKKDGCLIAYEENIYEVVSFKAIHFDDLAKLNEKDKFKRQSFCRHNVAVLAHIRVRSTETHFTVANAHLYWNPNFPEVKVGQAKYLIDNIWSMRKEIKPVSNEKIIVAGDFNSLPESDVYCMLNKPFRCANVRDKRLFDSGFPSRYISYSKFMNSGRDPQFVCDATLSKFCRWLRILGISCTMLKFCDVDFSEFDDVHTFEEMTKQDIKTEKARKKYLQNNKYFLSISKIALQEERVILTTNKQFLHRADVPESFLIDYSDLEKSLADLLYVYRIDLDERKFLTICGE